MSASSSSSSSSSAPAASGAASGGASSSSRKRPRHFHAGPQPTAEEEEEKQQEEIAGQPPAARLYRHALESIFGFLSLQELSSVLAVSRSWSSAVGSMRSIDAERITGDSLFEVCASRLARHIGTLGEHRANLELDRHALYLAALRMNNLHTLYYDPSSPLVLPLLFPPSLTKLDIELGPVTPVEANLLIAEVSRISKLQSLTVQLPVHAVEPFVSFAPLVRLIHLRELATPGSVSFLNSDQIAELRALPSLTKLKYILWDAELRALLRPPHQLQLRTLNIAIGDALEPEAAALFASLPSLTDLSVEFSSDVAFLRFTPNLRTLHLAECAQREPLLSPEEMTAGLSPCEHLMHRVQRLYCCSFARHCVFHAGPAHSDTAESGQAGVTEFPCLRSPPIHTRKLYAWGLQTCATPKRRSATHLRPPAAHSPHDLRIVRGGSGLIHSA